MIRNIFFTLLMTPVLAYAQTVSSPDEHLKVNVELTPVGAPVYSVYLDQDQFVAQSPLGLKTTVGDFTTGLSLANVSEATPVSGSYTLANGKKSLIEYNANEVTYSYEKDGRKAIDIIFHVDNNNIAFRYKVYKQRDRMACLVEEEMTAYTMPQGTTTFLCAQMTPQGGFARTTPSYETFYEYDAEMGSNGQGRGFTFPALFRNGDKGWMMLCETGVDGTYCGSRIECKENVYSIAYPEATEFGGVGTSAPGLMLDEGEGLTPWRTITIGRTLQPIAETTIMWDVVKPLYEASQEYKYGKSAWSWIIRMDASCNFDEQKEYVDFAAAMGWEYLLIDAWWDANIGKERMEEICKYAATKNVGIFLWYNSNGYWNDAPQGPRGKLHRSFVRRSEMQWLKDAGVKGLKIDFIGSDKQQTMQMYEDILADANDYGLMIIFHGCTIPRGWERMFPNFVACEAVRASENLSFGQYDNDVEAKCGTIHPILRNAIGNMDFGGSALNKFYSKNNQRGRIRRTSDVYALATATLFQTPVQNFAVAPNNLEDAPAWAIDFMKNVPTTWDDVKFIDGYPGKYLIMARRTGDTWFVSAINAEETPLKVKVQLPMFAAGSMVQVYSDTPQLEGSVKTIKVNKKQTFEIVVPCNGGLVIKN